MRDTYMEQFSSTWTETALQDFRSRPVVVRHNYHEHQAFSDMALAALIERHPRELTDICTMGDDATARDSWRAGEAGDLSGLELIDAVRNGKLWINLRHAMDQDEQYRPIFESMLRDMRAADPSFRPLTAEAGILISSPSAQVFLHSDVSETMLWHMRGVKRFRTYPVAEPFLKAEYMEAILHHEQTEDIPFQPDWDEAAFTVDLHPGMAANWPLHGPHRIENQSGINVSVPFEISTPQSRRRNAIHFANGLMRRSFGMNPTSLNETGLGAEAKIWLTRMWKLKQKILPAKAKPMPKSERTFEVDPDARDGFIDREAA
ncbi:hypothetical protein [Maricaulis sp.]|uniref:hypothetical protein n=1 Tax=Maricaulis sp. TaxID=1486257 RepID=UPI0026138ECC|nr:hypothetical protein [Maricaulis sp.]